MVCRVGWWNYWVQDKAQTFGTVDPKRLIADLLDVVVGRLPVSVSDETMEKPDTPVTTTTTTTITTKRIVLSDGGDG